MREKKAFPFLPALATGLVLLYGFFRLYHVLLPFVLACAIAYVLDPLIGLFEARGVRRSVAVLGLYLAGAALIALLASTLIQIATSEYALLQAQAPDYLARGKNFLALAHVWIARRVPFGAKVAANWDERIYGPLLGQAENLPSVLLGLFPILSFLFLVPFITFFLLLDGQDFISWAIQVCPSRYVEQALHLLSEIDTSLGNYLRGLVIVAAAITAASFLGLWALGVNQALAIAILSGVGSFVPYLGAALGAVVGGLAAVYQFRTAAAGLEVVLLFLLIRLADETTLQPIIAKHSVHLHPLVFLLSLLIGGELFGFMGLVFAVPAACVIKALVSVVWSWYSSEARLAGTETIEEAALPYT